MPEPKTVKIIEGGMAWNACYAVEGMTVHVYGAYGDERAPLGRKQPEAVAQDVLRGIVQRWEPARARSTVKRRP